ncbi:MAG TPA: hypothetical protein PKK48_03775 [Phycisphaerae bacterium]|nr:hypothetical protein [Phycisphaerae bacterium]HPS51938.1 hypothetical protein [Phycisphaerae bacterium]
MNTNDLDNISAWMDGELDAEESEKVRKILFDDAQAAMTCADFRKLDKFMKRWETPKPAEFLGDVICLAAEHDPAKSPFYRITRLAVPLTMAAIAVLAIMMWVGGARSTDDAASLAWSHLTPAQQSQASRSAKAFLLLPQQEQAKILAEFQKRFNISPSQNDWVGPVLSSFTLQERDELLKLSPVRRLEILRKRQLEMAASGTISQKIPQE